MITGDNERTATAQQVGIEHVLLYYPKIKPRK